MRGYIASTAALFGLLALLSPAWADQQDYSFGPHMWGGGWMLLGPLMMILFIAAIIAVVVLLVRWLGGSGHGGAPYAPPGKTALDILKERFARGELDSDEFEERRRALGE